jgi:hypothetical protein
MSVDPGEEIKAVKLQGVSDYQYTHRLSGFEGLPIGRYDNVAVCL